MEKIFVSEEDIENTIMPAMGDWINESGILRILKKTRIRNYAFLLVGSTAYGYAIKKSDTDLLLIYERYEEKYNLDDYKRIHERLHKTYCEARAGEVLDAERAKKTLCEKTNKLILPLGNEKELTTEDEFAEKLSQFLGMELSIAGRLDYRLCYYTNQTEKPCAHANETLSAIGLRFGNLFLRSVPHISDLTGAGGVTGWRKSEYQRHPLVMDERLADTLFVLKEGKVVFAPSSDVVNSFRDFLVSLTKVYLGCEIVRSYCDRRKIEIRIKKWERTGSHYMDEFLQLFKEESKEIRS